MNHLRIAVALPHFGVYGGIRRFFELGRVWVAKGHEVALLTPPALQHSETPWLPFEGHIGDWGELAGKTWDAVLCPDPALFLKIESPGALRVFYAVLEGAPGLREACRAADLVLANSKGMVRHVSMLGVQAAEAAGGVNLEFFHPDDPDPRIVRARTGAPVQVLIYGRLSRPRKGSRIAVKAVESAARSTRVPVELTLFDTLPPSAAAPTPWKLAVSHRWVLGPSQDDLRSLYANADLFVSAERRAGWSNTAAEAMACGAAVVCTRSGTEDFAIDGLTAAVSWPWSWAIARKIAPLLRDPEGRVALAAAGRSKMAKFPWERTADRIETAIRSRLAHKAGAHA